MAESTKPARRVFLRVLGAAAASWAAGGCSAETGATGGLGGLGGTGGMGGASSSSGVGGMADASTCDAGAGTPVGDPANFATDGLHLVAGTSVLIGRDPGGVYALSSICPHRGCNMNFDGEVFTTGIECRCHGSIFTLQGALERGPATSGLVAYAVTVACGQLYVDTSQTVPATQRLMA